MTIMKNPSRSNSSPQSLTEWLMFLESLKTVRSVPNSFSSVRTVIDRLNLWPSSEAVITVTGTNGKGSCVATLESIYLQAKLRVGAFTSPHLLYFNERIRVQGEMASDEAICEAFNAIDEARQALSLNYFQFSFLAALFLFKRANLDLIILEAGIGGRSDVVNLIDTDLAIITSIDLDHCDVLGYTRTDIAREKAGIMRAYKPIICGDKNPPSTLSEIANNLESPVYSLEKNFFYESSGQEWTFKSGDHCFEHLPIPAIDLANAAAALMGILCLRSVFPVFFEAIRKGLKQVFLPGRFQSIDYLGRKMLVDVAHNPAAAEHFFDHLRRIYPERRIHAIIGMQKDKNIRGVFAASIPFVERWYLISLPLPRGAEAEFLAAKLEEAGEFRYQICENVDEMLKTVLQNTTEADLIVVFGSFVTVAEVMKRIDD